MYRKFIENHQKLNGMEVNTVGNCKHLKYAIGKGNNTILVQLALKNRWWWQRTKKSNSNVNFLWTQLMCKKFISNLEGNTSNGVNTELELEINNFGSNSHTNLKESGSTSDAKNTTASSMTNSSNNFPSTKLTKINAVVSTVARKRGINKIPK
jgi:hypothetical protein